jgi:phosphoglycolate phosphatase-like HAD superfamily hydrolase
LFDIDGTLVRRAGPHHRIALVDAIRRVTRLETTTEGVPVAGMLDPGILETMMRNAGATRALARESLPRVIETAQRLYVRSCPDLRRRVCPGAGRLLGRIRRSGAVIGLVTGNLTRIGWTKMRRAGLAGYFRFGEFGENAPTRAGLVRNAIRRARAEGWIGRGAVISLVGDHVNDIKAAQANKVRSVATGTGILTLEELARHSPDILVADMRRLDPEMLISAVTHPKARRTS